MASDLGEMVSGYVTELAKEIGLDEYVPETVLKGIIDPIVTDVTDALVKATGLSDLFGGGGLKDRYNAAVKLFTSKDGALYNLPEQLIAPIMEIVEDSLDLGDLSEEQLEALEKALLEELKTRFLDNFLDLDRLTELGKLMMGEPLKWVKKEGPNLLKGMFTGDKKAETWKKATKELTKQIIAVAAVEMKRIAVTTLDEALQNVNIPGATLQNKDRAVKAFSEIKDAFKEKSVKGIFEDAADYVTGVFKEQVFDYEKMVNTIAQTNFKEKIIDGLRNGAKKASVEVSNAAISWLTSTIGVELEAEQAKATGHVVDTQAISGAGTKNVGVAGSVAITVLNADTKATIADGGKMVVTGETTVDANELRSVKNVASAALDAKGNAKDNKASEDKDNKNVGGGNDAASVAKNDKNTINLSVGVGGTASILEGDKGKDRPVLHITLKEGYKLPEGDKVNYTYTNKDGFEVNGTVNAKKEGNEWVIDPASDSELKKADKDTLISLEVKPVEVLHKVPVPKTDFTDLGSIEKGAVTVSVKGREPASDNTLSARVGETVEIKIAKKAGRVVNALGYAYKDADGKVHEVELTGNDAGGKEKLLTMVSSNENEIIYSFTMPDADVTDILVSLVKGEEEASSGEAETAAKDKNGASVGVGAAFSMVYGDTQTQAEIGQRSGTITVGALNVTAASTHMENISSAAGTDPLSGDLKADDTKKFSVDASVALNILDTDVKARNRAVATKVTGYADGEEQKAGDLVVTAKEEATTETTSSAFAVGGQTAVGASVAINIANSGVKAEMLGDATVDGSATVSSASHSEDVTKALATAMGADVARVASKIGGAADTLENKTNKVLDGSYLDKSEDKKDNKTANKINDRLNDKKDDKGKDAKGGAATSSNVLRSLPVETQNGEEGSTGTSDAMGEVSGQVGSTLGVDKKQEKQKVEVAAAVGLTIASHEASTEVGKIIANKKIETTSENTGNFNTMGTGAAMSLAEKSNAIAMGVAVSVNSNKAGVKVKGDLESTEKEDVSVTSKLTQNMDGDFQGKLAAQSLAGSVSGKGGAVSIAGAVSVVVSKGKSTVDIAGGTEGKNRSIKGGNVTVQATDKSKITARAGGLSLSTGASMGMGIGSTNIITSNDVTASVGDYTTVEADSFKLNAEKQEVTAKDFKNLIDMRYLITDSSKLSDAQRENASTGLIDFHKGEDDKNYKVEVNLDSEKLLDAIDGLNFLSGQNTYAEAIAGSISGGASSSLAGSFAVVVTDNDVKASMGKGVKVTTATGDVDVRAKDGNTTRIIAGSLSAAPAVNSTGATVAVLVNSDTVKTEVGADAVIKAAGDIRQKAEATGDQQVFTAAMSLASGAAQHQDSKKDKENGGSGQATDTGKSMGGAINVIVSSINAKNVLGNGSKLNAGGSADVTSAAKFDLMAISGSAGVAAGGGTALGGTVNVIVDSTAAKTNIGNNVIINAGKDLAIGSDVSDQLISGTASLSAAGSSGMTDGMAGAAVVNVIVSHSKANTAVGKAADLTAAKGDMKINANNDAWMLNASLAVAGAKNLAVGGAFNVNVYGREATVDLAGGKLNAGGDMAVQTSGKDTGVMAGLTVVANASTEGDPAVNGNIGVTVEKNKINTKIADGVTATAGKSAMFESYFSDYTVAAAGSITGSGGGSSLSGTVVTVVKNNDVRTDLGKSTITAKNGGKAVKSLSGQTVSGLYVGANAKETQFVGAAGMAAASGSSINGEIVTLVNNNKVIADASRARLSSYVETVTMPDPHRYLRVDELDANGRVVGGYERWAMYIEDEWNNPRYRIYKGDGKGGWIEIKDRSEISDVEKSGGAVTVDANDDTCQMLLAGGISVSRGLGAGAAAAVVVSNKTVEAKAHELAAYNGVKVNANNHDRLAQLALSVGVSTGGNGGGGAAVQIGAAVQSLGSKANAVVDGDVTSETGAFDLTAKNTTNLTNAAAALALSKDIAATPVFAYTGFTGEATANLKSGTVKAKNGVNVVADSNKTINQYTVGVAASGQVALSGALSVMTLKDKTSALVAAPVSVTARSLKVNSDSDYTLRGASGTLAGSGTAAVALNGMVSVIKANTLAEMAGKADVKANGLTVEAGSRRDIINAAATVSAAGTGAISAGVMALVAGDKMDQEAADQLVYGSSTNKKNKLFDADAMIEDLAGRGIDTSALTDMSDDLSGNGQTTDTDSLGHQDGKGRTFDVASAYDDGASSNASGTTGDIERSKKVGSTAYTDSPKDAVIARIAESADITGGVKVKADQTTLSDLYGASVGVGGEIGGGISIALAKLRSNVLASSTGTIHAEGKDVTVEAVSGSEEAKEDADGTARTKAVKAKLGDELVPANRSIRAIGLAVGGSGGVAGAVSAAFVRLDNITDATLAGHVEKAKTIGVNGQADYGNVLAATIAAGGGAAGIAGSLAIAVADGTVNATLGKNKNTGNAVENDGSFSGSEETNVWTDSKFKANAVAVSAAAGGLSAAGGLALATNNLTQNTTVERGVKLTNISGIGTLNVMGISKSEASSNLMGLSIGGGAVGLGVSIAKVKPTVNTTLGVEGAKSGTTDLTGFYDVKVDNDVTSEAESKLLSAAAGGVSVGVNVMNVYNDTKATAKAANLNGTVHELKVTGLLSAKGDSDVTAIVGGGAGIGVTVNYVDVNSRNKAEADLTNGNLVVKGRLAVTTGDKANTYDTTATAKSLAAEVGAGVVGVNTAVAHNRAVNESVITGKGVNAHRVDLNSYSKGTADAKLTGIAVGTITIANSQVNAENEATSIARMALTGKLSGNLSANSDVQGTTTAKLTTGAGSLLSGHETNKAKANGSTASIVNVEIAGGGDGKQSIETSATGKDTVKATVENLIGLNIGLSKATMEGSAYSHDVYSNNVRLAGGNFDLSKLSVITDYDTSATSDVTPSTAGVVLNTAGVATNKSTSASDVYAGAMATLKDGSASVDGDVTVKTTGKSIVDAVVKPASFNFSLATSVGTNKTSARSEGQQAATLKLINGHITKAKAVDVESIIKAADAKAIVSANGREDENKSRVKISAVSKETNTAEAIQNIASTAAILGEGGIPVTEKVTYYYLYLGNRFWRKATEKEMYEDEEIQRVMYALTILPVTQDEPTGEYEGINNSIEAESLTVRATNKQAIEAEARSDGAYSAGFATAGSLEAKAATGAVYNAVFDRVKANVTGDAVLMSQANAIADAIGAMPGDLSAVSNIHSDIKAGVGTEANKQISKVLVGEDSELTAGGALKIHALNNGEAEASFRQGTSISLAEKASSSQPVDSWLSTAVVIGNGAKLSGGNNTTRTYTTPAIGKLIPSMTITETVYGLDILSKTTSNSKSQVEAKNIGLLLNMNKMMGEVAMHSHTDVTIGDDAELSAQGDVNIWTTDITEARATTDLTGGGLFDGTIARAKADIDRRSVITVGKSTSIEAKNGGLFIQSRSGQGDDIQVIAKVEAGGAISIARARTDATVTSFNEINVLEGADLKSRELMRLYAIAGSSGGEKEGAGIYVYPKVKSYGVGIAPEAKAVLTMNLTTNININRGGKEKTKLTSERGRVRLYANNEGLFAFVDPGSDGKAAGGLSEAKTDVIANLKNLIWIDAADISAFTDVEILANNGNGSPARIKVRTLGELYSAGGKVRAENWIKGELNNQIRTNDKSKVTFTATKGKVTHEASVNLKDDVDYTRERAFFTTSKEGGNNWEWKKYWRCDFCGKSGGDNNYTGSDIKTIGGRDASNVLKSAFEKALSPMQDIQRQVDKVNETTRARYGEEDYAAASVIFVLELPELLGKDVTLNNKQISKYRLWNNSPTRLDVYMLPNATRLYGIGDLKLHFVSEVLRGDVRGNGESHEIDIVTALTDYAVGNPVIPVGSMGSLDFSTGTFTLPSKADFVLYLHEISQGWLIDGWQNDFFQALFADQQAMNDCALNGGDLPQGTIVRELVDDGEADGWHRWWIGATPETAEDPDQTLVYLLTNAETDEVDAFRTTANAMKNGEAPVDVSLYLYRDSKADRMEKEKYNVMFFDTPEGEKSLVKAVSNVLPPRSLEMPLPMHILLRGCYIEGADWPVYSLSDHYFALCDGTDGQVGMFDDFYTNTFDGDTFDSNYIRIEGIVDGDLNVTVKEGQEIWPERTGKDDAEDIEGKRFVRLEDQWYPEDEVPQAEPLPEDAAAA